MSNGIDGEIRSVAALDKTDWRKTIHKKLEECVNMEGTRPGYKHAVKKLISAVAADYPGFDAKEIINTEIEKIKKKHDAIANRWINKNPTRWAYPWIQWEKETKWELSLYKEIFEFIKDLCAKRRMLLWGAKVTAGGIQMKKPSEHEILGDGDVEGD